mgnify:CR=1 FL=1
MGFLELFLIGVGLSMDAFAVAICQGLSMTRIKWGHALTVGLYFGGFQALMPLLGWVLGSQFSGYIQQYDHWVAFILLLLIGGNMIREALSGEEDEAEDTAAGGGPDHKKLFLMAIATSIDALAVGLSFSLLNINVWGPSTLIGVVCAVITALGLLAGKGLAHADIFGRRAELVGGCVLIGIGLKILYEHGVLS